MTEMIERLVTTDEMDLLMRASLISGTPVDDFVIETACVRAIEVLESSRMEEIDRIFGSRERSIRWMTSPLPALGGDTPLHRIVHGDWIRVLEILAAIEHGVFP